MNERHTCPKCGGELPSGALEGLCPQCLIRTTLASLATATTPPAPGPHPRLRYFGDYELLEEIAGGGMGVVYRARQLSLNRLVAVKMIRAGLLAGDAEVRRFRAEAEAAASLDHPNIVPLYEVGEHGGQQYFAMKLVEGGSLAERIANDQSSMSNEKADRARSPFDIRHSTFVIARVARAIHYAHQRGILHRDLKPGNILLDAQGEPHVADFGIATRLESETQLTKTGAVMGTPSYMSPEQAAGKVKQLTTATDIYSLGAILYELLTGQPPFHAGTSVETLRQIEEREPQRPGSENPQVDRDLDTICLKCLQKNPARRYATAAELADDLECFLRGEPILARPVTTSERLAKWARRHPALTLMGLLLSSAVIVGVAGITWQWRRAESALGRSQQSLWQANFDRAHALRTSRQMGQRVEALKAIRAAAKIRPTSELRNEAIAAMALTDLEDVGLWYTVVTNTRNSTLYLWLKLFTFTRNDGVVEVRSLLDGQVLATITNSSRPTSVGSAGPGELLAVNDGVRCRFWDWRTTNLVSDVSAATFRGVTADGLWRLDAVSTSSVAWRQLRGGDEIGQINGINTTAGFGFSSNKELLGLTSDHDHEVWRVADKKRLGKLTLPNNALGDSWHPREPILAIGCEDSNVYVWDVMADRLQKLAGHRREGVRANWHPDGNLLSSVAWDNVLRLWDPFAGVQLLETTFARPDWGFSPDGQWLGVGNARGVGRLKVHIPEECRLFHVPLGLKQNFGVAFSPDDRFIAGLSEDGLWIWDVASGHRIAHQSVQATWVEFTGPRTLVTTGPDGVLLWTTSHAADGWMLIRQAVVVPAGDGRMEWGASFSPDGNRLAVKRGSTGEVYDFPSGRLRFKLEGQRLFSGAVFSPDGSWLASGYWDNTGGRRSELWIWSAEDGQPVRKIPSGNGGPVFSPDGRWLLVASDKEYSQFAINGHPTNWPLVRQYPRDVSSFVGGGAACSADGKLLAVQADERIFRLLEAATGRELARLTPLAEANQTSAGTFSYNGRWFVAASDIGLHVWDLRLIRARLKEMNLDWDGPPDFPPPIARQP